MNQKEILQTTDKAFRIINIKIKAQHFAEYPITCHGHITLTMHDRIIVEPRQRPVASRPALVSASDPEIKAGHKPSP